MKKIISLLLVSMVLFITTTKAQVGTPKQFAVIAGDTISTTAALDTVSKVISATAGYSTLAIQVTGTKVSGTITAKAYLYSSVDGSTYALTDSATAFANSAGAQSVYFIKTTTPYSSYKVQVRNVGTITSTEIMGIKVWYVFKRYD